jgi:hypothetical protein
MEIIFVTLLLVFGGLLWLGLIAIALGAYYLLGRLILKSMRQAFLRPGTAQITAYEIRTPDLKEDDAEDARPLIRLELDCERHGQHFRLNLGPLTCQELFAALDQPVHRAACWMTSEDWQQLLQGRWITVACDPGRTEAILTSQVRAKREMLVAALLALATIVLLALLQT